MSSSRICHLGNLTSLLAQNAQTFSSCTRSTQVWKSTGRCACTAIACLFTLHLKKNIETVCDIRGWYDAKALTMLELQNVRPCVRCTCSRTAQKGILLVIAFHETLPRCFRCAAGLKSLKMQIFNDSSY